MEIVCPDCEARYEVAPRIVPEGRSVRCVRCGTTWIPLPSAAAGKPRVAVADATGTDARRERAPLDPQPGWPSSSSAPPEPPTSRVPLLGAWLASVAVLLVLGWGVVHFRRAIAADWPPSARLYASLGLRVGR